MSNATYTEKERAILRQAELIYARKLRTHSITDVGLAKCYCQSKLAHNEREVFAIVALDSQHQVIEFIELFKGTINAASVYPREVVKAVLKHNGCAILLCHNHPSNVNFPSEADKQITRRITAACELMDIRVLDHFIVSASGAYSFAEHGLL